MKNSIANAPRGPRLTDIAASLPSTVPFIGPEAQERARGRPFKARIGANENVFGPSPKAVHAMANAAAATWKYGDPENHDLKHALAVHHRVAPENIVVAEGVDALLGYLVRLIAGPGDRVVTSHGAYPTFNYHVAGYGAELVTVPYWQDAENPAALVAKAREVGAKLIFLANPDNPMGTWHDAATIQAAINDVPDGCLICLDEAYVEFAPTGTAPPFDTGDPRVIRMRTFSKAYGMAGARVGYATGAPGLIKSFDKIRNHFGVNRMAQVGALAALADRPYLQSVIERVDAARKRIGAIVAECGLATVPSATNFVAVDCGGDGEFAGAVLNALISRDVFVRMPFVAPQNRCIRISAGTRDDLNCLQAALAPALAEASEKR